MSAGGEHTDLAYNVQGYNGFDGRQGPPGPRGNKVCATTYSNKTHSQVRNGGLGMRPEPRICAPTLTPIMCVYAIKIMFVQGHKGEAGFKGPPGLRGSKVTGFILAVNLRWKWSY